MPRMSACDATWKVKKGVATKGKISSAPPRKTWRGDSERQRNFSQRGASLSA